MCGSGIRNPSNPARSDLFPPLITWAVMMICHTSAYLLDINIEFNPKITKKLKVCKDKSTSLFGVFKAASRACHTLEQP
jgi:hypothetical protein